VKATWRKPLNWPPDLTCKVRVKLLPSGNVVTATAVSCGGNPGFAESVEQAVLSASPLPVPADPGMFDKKFRNLDFGFKYED
jgi:colicin import membrane protein